MVDSILDSLSCQSDADNDGAISPNTHISILRESSLMFLRNRSALIWIESCDKNYNKISSSHLDACNTKDIPKQNNTNLQQNQSKVCSYWLLDNNFNHFDDENDADDHDNDTISQAANEQYDDNSTTTVTTTTQRSAKLTYNNPIAINSSSTKKKIGNCSSQQQQKEISYYSFLQSVACLCDEIIQIVKNTIQKEHDKIIRKDPSSSSVYTIVIAIPEGFYLPIAVCAVHIVTLFFTLYYNVSVCLVPIDPSSVATERTTHMLKLMNPILIITASENDSKKMKHFMSMAVAERNRSKVSIDNVTFDHDNDEATKVAMVYRVTDMIRKSDMIKISNFLDIAIANVQVASTTSGTSFTNSKSIMVDLILECIVVNDNERRKFRKDFTPPSISRDDPESSSSSLSSPPDSSNKELYATLTLSNTISHIVFTSGTTGIPKGCVSSIQSLQNYVQSKNTTHEISSDSTVLLASSISFDPCLSDIIATLLYTASYNSCNSNPLAAATLAISRRIDLTSRLSSIIHQLSVTHVLTTPTIWSTTKHDVANWGNKRRLGESNICTNIETWSTSLQLVALGGEAIPSKIVNSWRWQYQQKQQHRIDDNSTMTTNSQQTNDSPMYRLCATYGVTEACVYQTLGTIALHVSANVVNNGQNVGRPFPGVSVSICPPFTTGSKDITIDSPLPVGDVGEVVLHGNQLDRLSSYYNQSDVSRKVFLYNNDNTTMYYRTGDLGYIDKISGDFYILHRISDDGMIKWNGIRVELGEIESSLIDNTSVECISTTTINQVGSTITNVSSITSVATNGIYKLSVVDDAMASVKTSTHSTNDPNTDAAIDLVAYVVLNHACLSELGIKWGEEKALDGILVDTGPLHILLQQRCKLRSRIVPTKFVIIPKIPQSDTGKRLRRQLPSLQHRIRLLSCGPSSSCEDSRSPPVLLSGYGRCGNIVANQIVECLNLLPCQMPLVTTNASFVLLGGDSLAATRVVRSIYAAHHNIHNSRFIGGEYGTLDGPFDVIHLLKCKTLGRYVEWLDQHNICEVGLVDTKSPVAETSPSPCGLEEPNETNNMDDEDVDTDDDRQGRVLYDALLQACTQGFTSIAINLLDVEANPNHNDTGKRLGKTSGRVTRRKTFHSTPIHLACHKGDITLVRKLLEKCAKCNTPDASGLFPIHLIASSTTDHIVSDEQRDDDADRYNKEEENRRVECLKLLLRYGSIQLCMKDGNKQTFLHAAARSGHANLLSFAICEWQKLYGADERKKDSINWQDLWWRTPVHWAVLNGHVDALHVLISMGCDPCPSKPKLARNNEIHRTSGSSVAIETPFEMCQRLYSRDSTIYSKISYILEYRYL